MLPHALIQCTLPIVSKWRMAKVVRQGCRLDQVNFNWVLLQMSALAVQPQRDGLCDLGYFQGMSQAITEEV